MKSTTIFLTCLLLAACGNKQNDKESDTGTKAETENMTDMNCYMQAVYEEDGTYFMKIVRINFLVDDEAIEAAKKKGEAETFIDDEGNTRYYVPNDYYIEIADETEYIYPIAGNLTYSFVAYTDEGWIEKEENTGVQSFMKSLDDRPELFHETPFEVDIKNGSLTRIDEVYIP